MGSVQIKLPCDHELSTLMARSKVANFFYSCSTLQNESVILLLINVIRDCPTCKNLCLVNFFPLLRDWSWLYLFLHKIKVPCTG